MYVAVSDQTFFTLIMSLISGLTLFPIRLSESEAFRVWLSTFCLQTSFQIYFKIQFLHLKENDVVPLYNNNLNVIIKLCRNTNEQYSMCSFKLESSMYLFHNWIKLQKKQQSCVNSGNEGILLNNVTGLFSFTLV